jgi:hypothetical protein
MKKLTHILRIFPGNPIGKITRDTIDLIEKLVPTAKHVKTTQLTIYELSVPFLLEFECECFEPNITELQFKFDRCYYKNSDGGITEYSLLTGIEYKSVL